MEKNIKCNPLFAHETEHYDAKYSETQDLRESHTILFKWTGISQIALRPRPSRGFHGDCIRYSALSKLNMGSGRRTIGIEPRHR